MTAAEFTELIFMASALVGQFAIDFVSIVFAYVVAGHFVGANLSRFQFVVLTLLYSAFAAGIAVAAMTSIDQMGFLGEQFLQQHPLAVSPMTTSGSVARTQAVPPVLFFCAWAISVWYVASSRRAAAQQDASADSA